MTPTLRRAAARCRRPAGESENEGGAGWRLEAGGVTRRLLSLTLCVAGLAAVDLSGASLSDQPVAIGAGARALGMGGAFAAVADDATATTWNPAGLVQCERPEFAVSASAQYTRVTGTDDDTLAQLEHIGLLQPFFALGCMQTLGVAWQRQYDYGRSVAASSSMNDVSSFPTTFTSTDSWRADRKGSLSTLGFSYAIEPGPGLALGVTVNVWGDRWTGASSFHEASRSQGHLVIEDLTVPFVSVSDTTVTGRNDTTVLGGTSLVVGTWWQAMPHLTFALVVKPAHKLRLENSAHSVTETVVDGTPFSTDVVASTTRTTLFLPTSVTVGSAWRPDDLRTITCDATWTRWREYRVTDAAGTRSPINIYIPPDAFPDLWTLRAGYEQVVILPRVVLAPRMGLLAEWLPAASAAPSTSTADQTHAVRDLWLGATAGLGICQRRLIWDAAVQVRHGDNVGAGALAAPNAIADMTIWTARLGLTVQF